MLRYPNCLALVGMLAVGTACHQGNLPPADLVRYVQNPDYGLQQQQQVGTTLITATYQPADILIARELLSNSISSASTDSLRKKYGNATYFMLDISRNNQGVLQPSEDFSLYSNLLQTLAFRMQNYVRLTTSQGDTLRLINYYVDRTTTSAETTRLLFAFPKASPTGTWYLQVREYGLNTGDLTFTFDTQQLAQIPTLANN